MSQPATTNDHDVKALVADARRAIAAGRIHEAEAALTGLQRRRPESADAAILLARLALRGGDPKAAVRSLGIAYAHHPAHEVLAIELAVARATGGELEDAIQGLRTHLERVPDSPAAWLLLGQLFQDTGRQVDAVKAQFEALRHAQSMGVWKDPDATPPHLVGTVEQAVSAVRTHRRELLFAAIEPLRASHGSAALARTERAIGAYLGELPIAPTDPMQKPRYLYFPDLPGGPYLDPELQPWAATLRAAYADIRREALAVLREDHVLEDFVTVRPGDRIENYLGGLNPSWEAFFFYRHGERFDENHRRCPITSQTLESIELVRIPGQTPEICFSVLAPNTQILPHHGVTNTRTVMHLPLVVPQGCVLNIVQHGTHAWEEGRLVLFDDTYLHEASNPTDRVRVILLMDCWHPHLTEVERLAVARLAEVIGVVDVAFKASAWTNR